MVKRRVFYSFHYKPDSWRVSEVRNIGVIEGNSPASDNDWEQVTRGGDAAIKRWIDGQLKGRTCAVVLVGSETANRKWINYEIEQSWSNGKGVVGIHIHGLKDKDGHISNKGDNPFDYLKLGDKEMSEIVKCYNPQGTNSRDRYDWIKERISDFIEEAIIIRKDAG